MDNTIVPTITQMRPDVHCPLVLSLADNLDPLELWAHQAQMGNQDTVEQDQKENEETLDFQDHLVEGHPSLDHKELPEPLDLRVPQDLVEPLDHPDNPEHPAFLDQKDREVTPVSKDLQVEDLLVHKALLVHQEQMACQEDRAQEETVVILDFKDLQEPLE